MFLICGLIEERKGQRNAERKVVFQLLNEAIIHLVPYHSEGALVTLIA